MPVPVLVAEEVKEGCHPMSSSTTQNMVMAPMTGESSLASMAGMVESENTTRPTRSLSRGRISVSGRVPLSMIPRDCTANTSTSDFYCDDEFKLSLEYQPNMVLYPVEGLHSLEEGPVEEEGKERGRIIPLIIFQAPSSLCPWHPPAPVWTQTVS